MKSDSKETDVPSAMPNPGALAKTAGLGQGGSPLLFLLAHLISISQPALQLGLVT